MAATLPTLDQIDPAVAWKPWQPTAADPWGRKWAAHLYRRAAFGASREDLIEAERLGLEGRSTCCCTGGPTPRRSRRPSSTSAGSPPSATIAAISSAAGGSTACSTAATRCARS